MAAPDLWGSVILVTYICHGRIPSTGLGPSRNEVRGPALYVGRGDGTFAPPVPVGAPGIKPYALTVGDLALLDTLFEHALDHPDPGLREGDLSSPANPRRILLLREKLLPWLPGKGLRQES